MIRLKTYFFMLLLASLPSVVLCFSPSSYLTSTHQDWEFIQNVGGLAVGDPEYKQNTGWFLPVNCNVSGAETITTKPIVLNSALAAKAVNVRINQNKIQIWVVSCLASDKFRDPKTIRSLAHKFKGRCLPSGVS